MPKFAVACPSARGNVPAALLGHANGIEPVEKCFASTGQNGAGDSRFTCFAFLCRADAAPPGNAPVTAIAPMSRAREPVDIASDIRADRQSSSERV